MRSGIDSTKIKANANSRDIENREQLQKRYEQIEKSCDKRYKEWEECEDANDKAFLERRKNRLERQKLRIKKRT